MTSTHVGLFTDTNAFIQLRDLKDLQWSTLFPDAKRIDLIIASRVIEELDKYKNSTNNRKRDRARLALKLIEKASKNDDLSLIIRSDPIEIRIVISTAPPPDWTKTPRLDPSKPDDQLVAETVAFGNGAALFSYDTGPRIRARIANLEAFEPLDDWHLPQEKTDDQRKVTELERNLERALSTSPRIVASFGKLNDDISIIELYSPILEQIDHHTVERLTAAYLADHPQQRLVARRDQYALLVGLGQGFTEYDIEKYEREFAAFRHQARSYFQKLHEQIYRASHGASVNYVVKNDSGIAASGLRIEASLVGEATLLGDEDDVAQFAGSLSPPEPPKKPANIRELMSDYLGPSLNTKPRDPTGFYWFERPTYGSKKSALQCEDFRATRLFKDEVYLFIEGDVPFSGEVTIQISATNLPAPVTLRSGISLLERKASWSDESVQKLLPLSIRSLFERLT